MQYSDNHSRHLYFTNNSEENMGNLAVWLGVGCFIVITVEKDGEGHNLLFLCYN